MTAQSQLGAEARRSPKVPEILPTPAPPVQALPPAKRSGLGRSVVIAMVALLVSGWYWLYARQYADTDDAQINGNISAVSPCVQGTVTGLHVADNQRVRKGEVLLEPAGPVVVSGNSC